VGTLRDRARSLFSTACDAADPARALRAALARDPPPRTGAAGGYVVVSAGKAAVPMAEEMLAHLAPDPVRAVVVTNYENARPLPGAVVMAAGHPIPDENGLRAADAVAGLLAEAAADDQVIALISGGGSALLPAPAGDLTLADKAEVNRLLLAHGFAIGEMNLVRQQLSKLKGGGMLRLAAPAPVTAYILSDVIGDDLGTIASGPTEAPIGTRAEARALLEARGLWPLLPERVRVHLSRDEPSAPPPEARNHLIGSNRKSLEAVVAAAAELNPAIVSDRLTGDVAAAAARIVEAVQGAPRGRPACLIFGGETTVTLTGGGLGGRNQELALRVALAMPELGRDWAFLSGGTDGRDGPTDAAGGLTDAGTAARIRALGLDPEALLADNDSHAALKAADDLLITGGTGTNVADVQILLLGA
jgi:hydroxypyruvate reductase